ncbi:unnamed protein product [Amoebophrya sp. A25]|nr:unnamed protein product [Amoebophrya sp. A25]|eukprot:GSA25T00006994001.1
MSVSSASRVYFFIFSSFLFYYSNLAIPCVAASMTGSSEFLRRSTGGSDTGAMDTTSRADRHAGSSIESREEDSEDSPRIYATSDATRDSGPPSTGLREFVDVFCNKEDETRERALKILLTAVGREVLDILETAIGRDSTSKVGTYLLNEEKFVTQPVYRSITRPPQEAWTDGGLDEYGQPADEEDFVVWKGSVAELKRKAVEQEGTDSSPSWASTFLLLYQQVSLLLRSLGCRRGGGGTTASTTGLKQHQLYQQRPPLVNIEDDLEAALEAFRQRKEDEGVESWRIIDETRVSSFPPGFEQRRWENLGQYVRNHIFDLLEDESLFDQDNVELSLVARWEYDPGLTTDEQPDAEEAPVYNDLFFNIHFFGMMKADLCSRRTPMIAEQEEHGALQHHAPAGAGGASSSAFLGKEYYRSTGTTASSSVVCSAGEDESSASSSTAESTSSTAAEEQLRRRCPVLSATATFAPVRQLQPRQRSFTGLEIHNHNVQKGGPDEQAPFSLDFVADSEVGRLEFRYEGEEVLAGAAPPVPCA